MKGERDDCAYSQAGERGLWRAKREQRAQFAALKQPALIVNGRKDVMLSGHAGGATHQTPERGITVRILLNVKIPHQPFNAAVKDGTAGSTLSRILEAIKPEAVYFTEQNGQRGAVLIVDLPDPSKIPALAEPWFLTFEADVEFRVVMSPEDLKRAGVDELGKKWS